MNKGLLTLAIRPLPQGIYGENCHPKSSISAYNCLIFFRNGGEDYSILEQIGPEVEPGEVVPYSDIPASGPKIATQRLSEEIEVEVFTEKGIEKSRGGDIAFVYAKELKRLEIPKDAHPWNKIIKAVIDALDDEVPVIIEWVESSY